MYCAYCGTQIQDGQGFCTRCGRAVAAPGAFNTAAAQPPVTATPAIPATSPQPAQWSPSAPSISTVPAGYAAVAPQSRLACNLRTLGILWIVGSALRMIPALGMLFLGRMGFLFMPMPVRAFVLPIMGGLGLFLTVACVAGIAAGWGLLERRPWARTLAVVLGCMALIDFPFGTALGIYTLWVLLSPGADAEYERIARGRIGH